MINFFFKMLLMPTRLTPELKPPIFVTNPLDFNFSGLVADWNFSNSLVADWIEILAFTRPVRPLVDWAYWDFVNH